MRRDGSFRGLYTGRGQIRLAPQTVLAQRGGARELHGLSPVGAGNHTGWYRCPVPRVFGLPGPSPRPHIGHLPSTRNSSAGRRSMPPSLARPTLNRLGGGGRDATPATSPTTPVRER